MKYIKITLLLLVVSSILMAGCSGSLLQARSWPGMTLDDEILFVASGSGVFAIRLDDGLQVWRYPEEADRNQNFFADPLVVDGLVVVGDYKNVLHGLDAGSGSEQWRHEGPGGQYIAGAQSLGGLIFAPSGDHRLHAFDMDGVEQWTYETADPLWGEVAVNGDKVYLPVMGWAVVALEADSGKEVWQTELEGAVVSGPTLSEDGTLYIGSLGYSIYALDSDNGNILWQFKTGDGIWGSPTLHDGVVYAADASGVIYAVEAATGKGQWQLDAGGTIVGSGVPYADGLFFGNDKGELIAVSFDGKKQWTRSVEGKLYSTPVVTEDRIVAAVTDGAFLLIAWDFQGNELWAIEQPK